MEEINRLKKENEELKKKEKFSDQNKTRKEVQERDEELAKLKEEFHQNKRKHMKKTYL